MKRSYTEFLQDILKEVVHEEVEHRVPKDILANLAKLEAEIQQGMEKLEGLLG
ncbi:MAG: hypothetical protein KME23_08390 [Goleter apudmare HA4340-LM2]|jgi:type I restriction enzyme M protein|nr:hypothetical protein [Goleter apudmare HA4340-LM2]